MKSGLGFAEYTQQRERLQRTENICRGAIYDDSGVEWWMARKESGPWAGEHVGVGTQLACARRSELGVGRWILESGALQM